METSLIDEFVRNEAFAVDRNVMSNARARLIRFKYLQNWLLWPSREMAPLWLDSGLRRRTSGAHLAGSSWTKFSRRQRISTKWAEQPRLRTNFISSKRTYLRDGVHKWAVESILFSTPLISPLVWGGKQPSFEKRVRSLPVRRSRYKLCFRSCGEVRTC